MLKSEVARLVLTPAHPQAYDKIEANKDANEGKPFRFDMKGRRLAQQAVVRGEAAALTNSMLTH